MLCVAHNNTKYYLIASYLLEKPTNNRTRQKKHQNLMKYIKVHNRSETKLIIETLQEQLKEFILFKILEDTALHKHSRVNQKKDISLINVGSNKVCVMSFTKF